LVAGKNRGDASGEPPVAPASASDPLWTLVERISFGSDERQPEVTPACTVSAARTPTAKRSVAIRSNRPFTMVSFGSAKRAQLSARRTEEILDLFQRISRDMCGSRAVLARARGKAASRAGAAIQSRRSRRR
jgi:hypothetical protein